MPLNMPVFARLSVLKLEAIPVRYFEVNVDLYGASS